MLVDVNFGNKKAKPGGGLAYCYSNNSLFKTDPHCFRFVLQEPNDLFYSCLFYS
jgi:hypothetical protein